MGTWGINTNWENLQICRSANQEGVSFRSPNWFVLFDQVVFIPQAQPHAQSLFLFPIVFGINLNLSCSSHVFFWPEFWYLPSGCLVSELKREHTKYPFVLTPDEREKWKLENPRGQNMVQAYQFSRMSVMCNAPINASVWKAKVYRTQKSSIMNENILLKLSFCW